MLVLVMLVRPFVSRVFLFFVVALLACNCRSVGIVRSRTQATESLYKCSGPVNSFRNILAPAVL
jgi:hypothetical protein